MNTPLSEKDKIRAQLKIHPQILAQLCTSRDFNLAGSHLFLLENSHT